MEEEIGQPPGLRHAWRGRKLWKFMCATALAAAVLLIILWALPNQAKSEDSMSLSSGFEKAATGETVPSQPSQNPGDQIGNGEEGSNPDAQSGNGGEATPNPGNQTEAPGMVIQFPDPAADGDQPPPPGGYEDVYGHWILDMAGSSYGLTNCHIYLEQDGAISSPEEYGRVFEIMASEYDWQSGSPSFRATLQLMVTMGSSQMQVVVNVELTGTVSGSCDEIKGDFDAVPESEAYAPYSQRGTFTMHR